MTLKEEIVAQMKPIEVIVKSLNLFQVYKQLQVMNFLFLLRIYLIFKNWLVGFFSL